MKALSQRLTRDFGKGFSHTNLKLMRLFYLQNQQRIGQSAPDQLGPASKSETLFGELPHFPRQRSGNWRPARKCNR